jgi:hypothetical protein
MPRLRDVSLMRNIDAKGIPLRKNCWPPLKNFDPFTEIVDIPATVEIAVPARKAV